LGQNYSGPGAGYAPAYQLSGVPFVTSSNGLELDSTTVATRIQFPSVTRWIQVSAHGSGELNLGFTNNGVLGFGGSVSGSQGNVAATGVAGGEGVGDHSNFLVISGSSAAENSTLRLELRCKELFFVKNADSAHDMGFSLIAGLTGIPQNQFPTLTGSQGFLGVG